MDSCRRFARDLQSFDEISRLEAESLETRYARDRTVMAGSDVDRNWDRFALPIGGYE